MKPIKKLVSGIFVLMLAASTLAAQVAKPGKFFPYPIHKKTLANGLDVIVIETPEFKNVLSYNTLVLAGARNEIEPGKTGLAHLFEHILFRHAYKGVPGHYEELMARLGTHNNAWTWFDVTYYHPLTFTANLAGRVVNGEQLPGLLELESSRFKELAFDENTFKTETGTVLGEYRRISTFPTLPMDERVLALMFPDHSYGHTTMGYYEDVLDMPNEYQAARAFYANYYRPNNCVLVVVGDVTAEEIFTQVEPYYRGWQPKEVPPIPAGTGFQGPKREHVEWGAEVAPRLYVAYRLPAFKTTSVETAVGQLLGELLVSRSAPLYKKLRFEKQTASGLEFSEGKDGFESFDPRALVFDVQLFKQLYQEKGTAYFDEVIRDIEQGLEELKRFSRQKGAKLLLDTLKSKYRYDFLAGMSSPAAIGRNFAWYYRFERDPEVLEKLLAAVEALQPRDIDAFAQKYFVPQNQVVITLAYKGAKAQN